MKKFYAVQVGDNNDWDYGSTVKRKAIVMANAEKRDPDNNGKEIRIAVIDCDAEYCLDEIIIRDGDR